MKRRIHLYSDTDVIECDTEPFLTGEAPTIWIRADKSAVSLTFSRDDRAKLRAALDAADAIADKGDT